MTQQIGNAYRKNRRLSWLVIAAVIAIAAVAIPIGIAGGGSDKYYTLGFGSGSTETQPAVCVGDNAVGITLKLSNKAKTQSLGSANITLPAFVTVTATSKGTFSGNVVKLRNLNLPAKTGSVTFTVTVNVTGSGAAALGAIVKQSNEFNDGGDANLFTLLPGTKLPTLTAENCYGTIEGTIWQDANEDGTQAGALETGQGTFKVFLYEKSGSTYTYSQDVTANYNGTAGAYKLDNVRLNREYLVCERASAGTWDQTTPPAATPPCEANGNEANGHALNFTASVTGKNFGNVPAVAASCTSTFQGSSLNNGTFEYEARLSLPDNVTPCKSGSLVMFTYQSGSTRVATLHPPGNTTGTKFPVVERIKWTGVGASQNPITLSYDDVYPYDGVGALVMPMCTSDPRPNPVGAPFVLGSNPDGVLPSGHTSCMIVSTEAAGAGGTYEAYVYSKVDGWKSG